MLKVQIENEVMIINIEEKLIAPNVKNYAEKIKATLEENRNYSSTVINIADSSSVDSMGITFLIGLFKTLSQKTADISLTGVSEDLMKLFKLMRLDEFFRIEADKQL